MLRIHNSISNEKEQFIPIDNKLVGIYLCGPTVYGGTHIGHARNSIFADTLVRYLRYAGYKVRYVRNVTDVGHLERDSDDGEDKIAKQASIEKLEPMEVAQRCYNAYRDTMDKLNVGRPSIEPLASGHILEQITMIQEILKHGYAYENEGSVYFDLDKYARDNKTYGQLSGRKIDELIENSRNLVWHSEKKFFGDFALWKKASPHHIMKWDSPWGKGFPGWHIECSAMSRKYLGTQFDFHCGGMDLKFPHHECEIAQSNVANNKIMAKYWLHHNMVTIDDQKMAKSLGNFITLENLFSGVHKNLSKSHTPMALRFFILQAHYRSTLAFSESAVESSYEAYKKIMRGGRILNDLKIENFSGIVSSDFYSESFDIFEKNLTEAMEDDLSTPKVIRALFDMLKVINKINDNKKEAFNVISKSDFLKMKNLYSDFTYNILGLIDESPCNSHKNYLGIILEYYNFAKSNKNYELVDIIRKKVHALGVSIIDKKDGVDVL